MKVRSNEARWIQVKATGNYRWQINVTNEDGIRKTFADSTPGKKGKLACERKADEWLLKGSPTKGRRTQDVFDSFIQNLKDRNTSKSYWKPYESYGENYIKPIIGLKRINNVTENDLEKVLQKAFANGLALKSIKNICSCMVAMMKYARKGKETDLMPEDLEIPKGAKKSEKFSMQEDELKVLLTSDVTSFNRKIVPEWFIHAFRFQVLMGYRPGEIAGFQTADIVGSSITTVRGIDMEGELTDLKNQNAKRTKKINALAMKELEAQKEMLKKAGMVTKWLFPGQDGNALNQFDYERAFKRYQKHNGIGKRILKSGKERYLTPYELRHTWVSLNDEMPEGLKKKAVGWSDNFDGDRVYGHEMNEDQNRIADFEDKRFKNLLK